MEPIDTELAPEERDAILERMAREVTQRGMEVPVVLALEIHRPLAFLTSQALVVFTPLLAPAFGLENLHKLAKLLEDRSNLDRLMDRIEELAMRRSAAESDAGAAQKGQMEHRETHAR